MYRNEGQRGRGSEDQGESREPEDDSRSGECRGAEVPLGCNGECRRAVVPQGRNGKCRGESRGPEDECRNGESRNVAEPLEEKKFLINQKYSNVLHLTLFPKPNNHSILGLGT